MTRAFSDVFQIAGVDAIPLSGRTDRWIVTELAARHGVTPDTASLTRFRETYVTYLKREIQVASPGKGVLPGVRPLLEGLAARVDVYLGLVTGNMTDGARIKLDHFDLWRYFGAGGFGDTAPERSALLREAWASVERMCGVRFQPRETVVVGDTPLDVAAAVDAGARSLAVTTGLHEAEALRAAGADVVLPDLSDLSRVLEALKLPPAPV